MTHKTTKPLRDVLDEFTHIGNCFYNGSHQDNVLNIFSELDPEDQKALLVGVFHVYSVMEKGALPDSFSVLPDFKTETVVADKKKSEVSVDPAALNTSSMIHLKVWIFKAVVLFLFIFFFGLVLLIFVFSQDANTPGQVSGFIKILSMLFK